MNTPVQSLKILFLSTFSPKKCGIASFTEDLINAIKPNISEEADLEVCALDNSNKAKFYRYPVTMTMDSQHPDKCIETAITINKDASIKLVCIEHEFGLYGGEMGEYLLGFLSLLEKPFIIRFHTVLPKPAAKMLSIVQAIGSACRQDCCNDKKLSPYYKGRLWSECR